MRPRWLALAALLAPLWLGAAHAEQPPTPDEAEIARLEKARDRSPRDEDTRLELGSAYYQRARRALDQKDFTAYERYLGQAMDEMVESLRLDPESPSPHTSMGIVAAYQGNLDRALQSFANARRLEPRAWTAYTNVAQVMTYRGASRRDVERWIKRGERLGAEPGDVDLVLCLASWRDGYMDGAERHFKRMGRLGPRLLERWDGAPLATPLQSLADLMAYCCSNPACGPYLAEACKTSSLEVAKREIPEEVARRELVIEMERRRKLNEIYEKRKDLEIEVERPEETPPAPPTP